MKKILPALVFILVLLVSAPLAALAHDTETVSYADLGGEPALYPTHPFYFLKEWKRQIAWTFARNQAKKLALKTRWAKEELAELKKLAAVKPNQKDALAAAADRYRQTLNDILNLLNSSPEDKRGEAWRQIAPIGKYQLLLLPELQEHSDLPQAATDAAKAALGTIIAEAKATDPEQSRQVFKDIDPFFRQDPDDGLELADEEAIINALKELEELRQAKERDIKKSEPVSSVPAPKSEAVTPPPAEEKPEKTPESENFKTVATVIKGFAFEKEIRIKKGDTVVWTNEDSAGHTVTSETGIFKSRTLFQNNSFSFTFENRGSYAYFCEPHPWMTGVVIVE